MKKYIYLFLIIFLNNCTDSVEPEILGDNPFPVIKGELKVPLGSYIELDASESWQGAGDTLIYKWADLNYSKSIRYIAAITPGIQEYSLMVYNGLSSSNEVKFKVEVINSETDSGIPAKHESLLRYISRKQLSEFTDNYFLQIDSIFVDFKLEGINQIDDLTGFEKCKNLEYLNIGSVSEIDLSPFEEFTNLKYLNIYSDKNNDLTPISYLKSLEKLSVWMEDLDDVSFLSSLVNLKYLDVNFYTINSSGEINSKNYDFSFLGKMKSLEKLNFNYTDFQNCDFLNSLQNIKTFVSLNHYFTNEELRLFSRFKDMKQLLINGGEINSLEPIKDLINIYDLGITNNKISDLTPLKNYKGLRRLSLTNNQIEDISPLVNNDIFLSGYGGFISTIDLMNNPLNDEAKNKYIPELEKKGYTVFYNK